MCETPKSPPGDYNPRQMLMVAIVGASCVCETPKSPPEDYNPALLGEFIYRHWNDV